MQTEAFRRMYILATPIFTPPSQLMPEYLAIDLEWKKPMNFVGESKLLQPLAIRHVYRDPLILL